MSAPEPIYTPPDSRREASNLARFIRHVVSEWGAAADGTVEDYAALHDWSVRRPEQFWPAVWEFCGIRCSRQWDAVLEAGEDDAILGSRWFPGAKLNFAQNLLRHDDDRPAIVFRDEAGNLCELSHREVRDQALHLASWLRQQGVESGDRVAGFLPNLPESIIAMLATTALGAIWSSCSPDFGIQGVLDRFSQIKPKVLFTADGYHYNGKRFDSLAKARQITAAIASIEQVVVVPFTQTTPDCAGLNNAILFEQARGPEPLGQFVQVDFDHPLYIMYSSGTTGTPKCIVHGTGGTLLQHLKELVLHTNLRREDRIFYFTTCGWMMWNWLVSSLAVGATVVLYDGSPFHPNPHAMWDFIDQAQISIFGTGARYIAACEKEHLAPAQSHDLASLHTILSTGSPLMPENYDYVYQQIKDDVLLCSISGGTDIISCFALGNPMLPVYRGELQCRGLGMAVKVFDETGTSVVGEKGELVCTHSFPSRPVKFWNDAGNQRYREAYFSTWPQVWAHGDHAQLIDHGSHAGVMILGRSDAVLNPGGVRIGTAEIYRQVEKHDEVLQSIAVGQNIDGDQRIILFVQLREGLELTDDLRQAIAGTIRKGASPRHVPAKILQVPDIPRTISGKIVELAVQRVIHGQPVKNRDALANPEALDHFANRPELVT